MGSLFSNIKWRTIQTLFKVALYIKRSRWLGRDIYPDLQKRYPSQTELYPSRIFIPKHRTNAPLPLLIDVHGGAFIVNTPAIDDRVARYLADHGRCVVVSIDYRKAPQNPFPAGYEDVVGQISAVLKDADLPVAVDRSKTFLFGSSAGGNLVLGAAQDARLRGQIAGVIGLYAVTDGSIPVAEKVAARPNPNVPDILAPGYDEILSVYTGNGKSGVSMSDVRFSPGLFSKREDLPEHVFLIGAEHDLLSNEAKVMAEKLAGDAPTTPLGHGWRAGSVKSGSVRWENVPGQTHGFDLFGGKGETKELKAKRLKAREETYHAMTDWLLEFSERSEGQNSDGKGNDL